MIHEGRVKSLPADYSTIRAVWSDSESNFKAVQRVMKRTPACWKSRRSLL